MFQFHFKFGLAFPRPPNTHRVRGEEDRRRPTDAKGNGRTPADRQLVFTHKELAIIRDFYWLLPRELQGKLCQPGLRFHRLLNLALSAP